MKSQEDDGNNKGNQGKENKNKQIAGQHVRVKTNGERKVTRQMRNDLDGQHERHQPPHRPHKLLGIAPDSLRAEANVVVVNERGQGDAKRNDGIGGRSFDTRQKPIAITNDQEETDNRRERDVRLISVADDGITLRVNEIVDHLGDVLQEARLLDIEGEAHRKKERHEEERGHQLQRERGADRGRRIGGVKADRLLQRRHRRAKDRVQKISEKDYESVHKWAGSGGASGPY